MFIPRGPDSDDRKNDDDNNSEQEGQPASKRHGVLKTFRFPLFTQVYGVPHSLSGKFGFFIAQDRDYTYTDMVNFFFFFRFRF
jgi:hypothetical protein